MSAPPCKFFNMADGCKFSDEDCKRRHVKYCTNDICVNTGKNQTHAGIDCGRKGGPKHGEWVAKKKAAATVAPILDPVVAVCEKLYIKVDGELKALADAIPMSVKASVSNLAGKMVGMFKAEMTFEELELLLLDDTLLASRMVEAVDVLEKHAT